MITSLSPLYHKVATYASPQEILLQKGSWVHFSDAWPDPYKWAKNKTFVVREEPLIVSFASTYTVPGGDYKEIDLSNATAGIKLYPEEEGMLYQCAVGINLGQFVVHTYVPKDKYVYTLGDSTMWPNIANAVNMYLGIKTHEDSPSDSPLWYLYFIKDEPAFYLRLLALASVEFEKMTLKYKINKAPLAEIINPTPEQVEKALLIRYYTQFSDSA